MNSIQKAEHRMRNIFLAITGCIITIVGIFMFINNLSVSFEWKSKENNYNKEYAYSSYGELYYNNQGNKIQIETIRDFNEEVIHPYIPDEKVVIFYCSKDNINDCIYMGPNESMIENPFIFDFVSLFFVFTGLVCLSCLKKTKKSDINNEKEYGISHIIFLYFLVFGVISLAFQVNNVVNYFSFKNNSNLTTAVVSLEVYSGNGSVETYRPAAVYNVDDQEFIYVEDRYVRGELEDDLGETFEIYYNKDNPSKAIKKGNPVNIWMVGIGSVSTFLGYGFFHHNKIKEKNEEESTI